MLGVGDGKLAGVSVLCARWGELAGGVFELGLARWECNTGGGGMAPDQLSLAARPA